MRPIGGVIIGHIGDRLGRRAALSVSIAAMAIPTCLIGLLPGYATLGLAAPIALVLLRMIQGLSVGGEFTSSMTFLVEKAPPERRGLMGSIGASGVSIGVLLGSGTAAVFAGLMSTEALEAWGWRVPFVLGLGIGVIGYFLRRHIADEAPAAAERAPIVETLRDHPMLVGKFTALAVFDAVAFYVMFVYVVSWLQTVDGIPPARALEINTISVGVMILAKLSAGVLADRFGRKPVPLIATGFAFVGAIPFFGLMYHTSFELVLVGQLFFAVVIGLFIGSEPVLMVEAAPARIRCTATAVGYNICMGVAGGLAPLAASWLVARTDSNLSPAFLVMGAAAVSFLAVLRFRETFRKPFELIGQRQFG